MSRFQFPASSFQFLVRAYQGLRLLLDPAEEGDPYMKETERPYFVEPKGRFVLSRRLWVKGI